MKERSNLFNVNKMKMVKMIIIHIYVYHVMHVDVCDATLETQVEKFLSSNFIRKI